MKSGASACAPRCPCLPTLRDQPQHRRLILIDQQTNNTVAAGMIL